MKLTNIIEFYELGTRYQKAVYLDALSDIITIAEKLKLHARKLEDDIKSTLIKYGYAEIKINTVFNPPWTTDWITDHAKDKLREYGIVPPEHSTIDKSWLTGKTKALACPRCKSKNTALVSQFGSTSCKALYKCLDCLEPFDYLKCI